MELTNRLIPVPNRVSASSHEILCIPVLWVAAVGAHVVKYIRLRGTGDQLFRGSAYAFSDNRDGGMYTMHYEDGSREHMDSRELKKRYNLCKDDEQRETAYVLSLRDLLVKRLKEEEEYERLIMYARDGRFDRDVGRPK
jgi:hypothetical protein